MCCVTDHASGQLEIRLSQHRKQAYAKTLRKFNIPEYNLYSLMTQLKTCQTK